MTLLFFYGVQSSKVNDTPPAERARFQGAPLGQLFIDVFEKILHRLPGLLVRFRTVGQRQVELFAEFVGIRVGKGVLCPRIVNETI